MRIATTGKLFAWDALADHLDLRALQWLLELLPDHSLLAMLRQRRYKGRNDYPVHVLWRVHLLRYFLRHPDMAACLAELERNPALREVAGIGTVRRVPKPWNISRFEQVLGEPEPQALLRQMFDQLLQRLGTAVPDLGQHTAGDSACLSARADSAQAAATGTLPQPTGGKKEYHDDAGRVVKVYTWFGYKFHLLVDVKHEVVLAWRITAATDADAGQIPALLQQAQANLPPPRMQSLAYDKAADDAATHDLLYQHQIKPLIQNRALWKEEPERMLPGHDGRSNIVYDEAGTIYCYNKVSDPPVKHKMSYAGYEKSRGTLKYRCPARREGWRCPSEGRCNQGKRYGLTVRVKQNLDLRRFPPIPRTTKEFERRYKGRTAVERVNARLKLFWGADDGNVKGAARFHGHVASIMLVHAAIATFLAQAPRYEGRSLSPVKLSRIARAFQVPPGRDVVT